MKQKKKIFILLLFLFTIVTSGNVNAATYTVTNLNNSGGGSLRQAIIDANNNPGPDIITFSVAGTINVLSGLPWLGDASGGTIIDGTSAPGYIGIPVISLSGPGSGAGIWVQSSNNNEIRALQITSFKDGI